MWKAPLAFAAAALVIAGCAGPKGYEMVKAGASASQRDADEKSCWHYTMNTDAGRKNADFIRVTAAIAGGPIAIIQGSDSDPRKEVGNRNTYQKCMLDKGYTIKDIY